MENGSKPQGLSFVWNTPLTETDVEEVEEEPEDGCPVPVIESSGSGASAARVSSRTCDGSPTSETSSEGSTRRIARTRTLQELYEVTGAEENSVSLFCLMAECEPLDFDEASVNKAWKNAMNEELEAIERNDTWELVDLTKGNKAIGVKWIFKTKKDEKGSVVKHKARLVVKGYTQSKGVDFDEVYAPVARMETVKLMIALAAHHSWIIFQMDFKSAFLNGRLQEEVYIHQPPGYVVDGHEGQVLKLHKALYGLKQAPRTWNSTLDCYLKKSGFERCPHEYAVYVIKKGSSLMLVCIYVDDILITRSDEAQIDVFKADLVRHFAMSDLGRMSYYLGIKVDQRHDGIFISQQAYSLKVLKQFEMDECTSVDTPISVERRTKNATPNTEQVKPMNSTAYRSLVGSLRYITCTRPDIMYAVGYSCHFMESPTVEHWMICKRIMRYLRGTLDHGLWYSSSSSDLKLVAYSDSDWGGDLKTRKSTTRCLFCLNGTPVTWISKLQPIVALSSAETEYIAMASSVSHAIWIQQLLQEMKLEQKEPMLLYMDNKSAMAIARNPVYHERSKHIDVLFHFLRECVAAEIIEPTYVKTQDQLADVLTKPLPCPVFGGLKKMLKIMDSSLKEVNVGVQAC